MARRVPHADRGEGMTLRINIAKEWATADFGELFSVFEMLNKMAHLGEFIQEYGGVDAHFGRPYGYVRYWADDPSEEFEIKELLDDMYLRRFMLSIMPPPSPLRVTQIEYASPGFTDLTGVGRIVAEIRKFVLGITDRFLAIEDRALAREERSQKILALKISNAEKLLKLSDKIHMDPEARTALIRRVLVSDRIIERQLLAGKITSFDGSDE